MVLMYRLKKTLGGLWVYRILILLRKFKNVAMGFNSLPILWGRKHWVFLRIRWKISNPKNLHWYTKIFVFTIIMISIICTILLFAQLLYSPYLIEWFVTWICDLDLWLKYLYILLVLAIITTEGAYYLCMCINLFECVTIQIDHFKWIWIFIYNNLSGIIDC